MARDQGQQGRVVTVIGQEGLRVHVTVPMVGFPEGFQLKPGARVVLVSTPSGPVARPLVRAVRAEVPADALEKRAEFTLQDSRKVVQDATVVAEQPSIGAEPPREDVAWVVESVDAEGPDQVIAVRRASPGRT